MARAGSRVDLIVVPADPDRQVSEESLRSLTLAWTARPPAGARAVRSERSAKARFYGNQQGGFRVRCPESGTNVVASFGEAVRRWRSGGERRIACEGCGGTHALESLGFAPPAAFACSAVILVDVSEVRLSSDAQAQAETCLGPGAWVVARRVS